MGRKKKAPAEDGGDARYNVTCKLRGTFADKLRMVADDLDQFPGEVIEQHMGDWVEAEYLRILRKRLAEAEAAAKDRRGGR